MKFKERKKVTLFKELWAIKYSYINDNVSQYGIYSVPIKVELLFIYLFLFTFS